MAKTLQRIRWSLIAEKIGANPVQVSSVVNYSVGTTDDADISKNREITLNVPAGIETSLTNQLNNTIIPNVRTQEGIA